MLLLYIDKNFSLIYLWMNYIIGNYICKNLYFITPFYFFSILFTIFSIYINNIFSSMVLNEKIRSINIIIVYQKKKLLVFLFIFVNYVIVNIVTLAIPIPQ
jgi:hypothetical protein